MSRKTNDERRRAGRAIRKARREAQAAAVACRSIDWRRVFSAFRAAAEALGSLVRVVGEAVAAVARGLCGVLAWHAHEASRARRDYMLAYRALEAGERGE